MFYPPRQEGPGPSPAGISKMNFNDVLASGKRATKTGSDAWVLRGGGKTFRTLVDSGGTLTKWGKDYEAHTGETLSRGKFEEDQNADRAGNTETIRLRGGGARSLASRVGCAGANTRDGSGGEGGDPFVHS